MPTHLAFQITEDDVANVLASNTVIGAGLLSRGLEKLALEELAAALLPTLDMTAIEDSALYGGTMQEQTDYACDEIAAQLRRLGILAPLPDRNTDALRAAP